MIKTWLMSLPIFFMSKIQRTRDNITENPVYQPIGKNISRLAEFRPFDQTEVRKIIFSMKTKSCQLDTLPTKLLKECIDSILQTITNLVNISLQDGVFTSRWKIQSLGLSWKSNLDLIPSNYHPVSNLSFWVNFWENVPWTVSMNIAIFINYCQIISWPITMDIHVNLQL